SVPALAGPPEEAGGDWSYYAEPLGDPKVAGCNMFVPAYSEGVWTGTFVGVTTEVGVVVLHCSGKASFSGTLSFEGEVAGKSGTMEMSAVGTCCDEQGHWQGQWVILSGTEGLANLRGQGAWFGPGAGGFNAPGKLEYAGNYHFEPE
ncbi:MAG TPA: DUF3224 domain-containing protein, partial [Anaerolineae bacterium]|nr:DUF3224 domain-containing protein [Anaerolineae bacterium]